MECWDNPLWIEKRIKDQSEYLRELWKRPKSARRDEVLASAIAVQLRLLHRRKTLMLQNEETNRQLGDVS